jgi:hypothetical protein
MTDFLFDTPYWFLGLLAVVGVGLWLSGNARQEGRTKAAALAVFLLAVALALVSYAVDTDKEKVTKRTHKLVEAVEKKDKAALADLLHPRASMLWLKKAEIIEKAASAADDYHLQNIHIGSLNVEQPNANEIEASVSVSAHVEVSGYGADAPSTWLLVWERTDRGWLLRDIKNKQLPGGIDMETIVGRKR